MSGTKHSSFLQAFINYGRKRSITLTTVAANEEEPSSADSTDSDDELNKAEFYSLELYPGDNINKLFKSVI